MSIYGDGLAHRKRLGAHYSDRTESILRVGPVTQASAPIIHGARSLKNYVSAGLRGGS